MALNLFNYDDPQAEAFQDESRILSNLTEAEWADFLATLERRIFQTGDEVLRAGDKDSVLYFVASGSVDVVVDGPRGRRTIALISAGSVFGEMAFFDGGPRSATIVAREPVEVLALDHEKFQQLCAWRPRVGIKLLMDLGRILSLRLRHLNRSM